MKEQVLSIEQMKHLASIGVDISKASMHWQYLPTANSILNGSCELSKEPDLFVSQPGMKHEYPAFTLQDLINMLPSSISHRHIDYFLSIRKNDYGCMVAYHTAGHGNIFLSKSKNILDSAYGILLWVIENKYN